VRPAVRRAAPLPASPHPPPVFPSPATTSNLAISTLRIAFHVSPLFHRPDPVHLPVPCSPEPGKGGRQGRTQPHREAAGRYRRAARHRLSRLGARAVSRSLAADAGTAAADGVP